MFIANFDYSDKRVRTKSTSDEARERGDMRRIKYTMSVSERSVTMYEELLGVLYPNLIIKPTTITKIASASVKAMPMNMFV